MHVLHDSTLTMYSKCALLHHFCASEFVGVVLFIASNGNEFIMTVSTYMANMVMEIFRLFNSGHSERASEHIFNSFRTHQNTFQYGKGEQPHAKPSLYIMTISPDILIVIDSNIDWLASLSSRPINISHNSWSNLFHSINLLQMRYCDLHLTISIRKNCAV